MLFDLYQMKKHIFATKLILILSTMFQKFKLAILLLCCTVTINAKNEMKENFMVKPVNKGWFAGPGVGTQFYVGDSDNLQSAGYRFSTALEGSVGKWITSSLAVRLQGTAARVTGGNIKGKKDAMNLAIAHIDLMADAMNFIGGVNENRRVTFMPFLGLGSAVNGSQACFSFNVGATALFRVSERVNLFTELKGFLLDDKMDGYIGGSKGEGAAVLSAGFIYNF